jgi:uncharacterized protein (DUF1778 family)
MTTATTRKEHPLSIRLPASDIEIIDRASKLRGRSRTDFMRDAAVREAEATILDSVLIKMTDAGFKSFVDAIESVGKPVPELVEVLKRKAPWEKT